MSGKLKVLVPPMRVAVGVNVMDELPQHSLVKVVPLAVRVPLTDVAEDGQCHRVAAGEAHRPRVGQRRARR